MIRILSSTTRSTARHLQRSSGIIYSELGLLQSTYLYPILSAGDVVSGWKSEGLVNGTNEPPLAAEELTVKMPQNDGGRRITQTWIHVRLSWSSADTRNWWLAVLAFCCLKSFYCYKPGEWELMHGISLDE